MIKLNYQLDQRKYFFSDARTAFLESMKLLSLGKKDKILLPAYIGFSEREGSGVFDPIKQLGIGYEFYSLLNNLSVEKEDFIKKIKQNDVKVVLVIHYFGFCQPGFDFIIQACKKYKKYLIEDCAHTLDSYWRGKKLGTYGDFGFYSIHKILPTRSGGILLINKDAGLDRKNDILENISRRARVALERAELTIISKKRRDNYKYVLQKIKNIKGLTPLFRQLPNGIMPQNFPIVIESDHRDQIYFYFRRKNIRVSSLYYRLILPIKKDNYPISHYLSRHILNLPIHQEMTREKIDFMLEVLVVALKKYESTSF